MMDDDEKRVAKLLLDMAQSGADVAALHLIVQAYEILCRAAQERSAIST